MTPLPRGFRKWKQELLSSGKPKKVDKRKKVLKLWLIDWLNGNGPGDKQSIENLIQQLQEAQKQGVSREKLLGKINASKRYKAPLRFEWIPSKQQVMAYYVPPRDAEDPESHAADILGALCNRKLINRLVRCKTCGRWYLGRGRRPKSPLCGKCARKEAKGLYQCVFMRYSRKWSGNLDCPTFIAWLKEQAKSDTKSRKLLKQMKANKASL